MSDDRERQWFKHAEDAGFVFLELPRWRKGPPKGGKNDPPPWTKAGAKRAGKFHSAAAALDWRDAGEGGPSCNLGVGVEHGKRGIILDADDAEAVEAISAMLEAEGCKTLSMKTPRGVAWVFILPAGVELAKLNETMVGGLGLLGTRPAGHYQVGPGATVDAGAYGKGKPPPDDSGGPWEYRVGDVVPVAVLPDRLIVAIREARARSRGEAPRQGAPVGAGRATPGRQALGCRTVEIGVAVLRDLVQGQGAGRHDSEYRVACSLAWHGVLTADTRGEVEPALIAALGELRAGEARDVGKEVREQTDRALAFVASQGGADRGSGNGVERGPEPVPPPPDDLAGDLGTWEGWKKQARAHPPSSLSGLKREAPGLLRQVLRRFGVGGEEPNDAAATLDAVAEAFGEGGEGAVKAVLEARGMMPKPRVAVPVPKVVGERPPPLLRLAGESGAFLSIGTVGVLSGEGGVGKSALTASLALALASRGEGEAGRLVGGVFDAPNGGGPVLLATWEDPAPMTRWRIEAAAALLREAGENIDDDAVGRVFVLDMAGAPLFGPRPGGEDRPGLYNARPEPLAGWRDLWAAVDAINPRLVVIDPVLAAFVGDSNKPEAAREFLGPLAVRAAEAGCAVLYVAHSTKAVRGVQAKEPDPFDPGQVGGSAAWTDGVRSALVLGWDDARGPGARRLAVGKSNYGPDRRILPIEPVRFAGGDDDGAVVAFKAADRATWEHPDALDMPRARQGLVDRIKAFRKAFPDADLGTLKRSLQASKGRKQGGNAGAGGEEGGASDGSELD